MKKLRLVGMVERGGRLVLMIAEPDLALIRNPEWDIYATGRISYRHQSTIE